jgi:hypothetical protein
MTRYFEFCTPILSLYNKFKTNFLPNSYFLFYFCRLFFYGFSSYRSFQLISFSLMLFFGFYLLFLESTLPSWNKRKKLRKYNWNRKKKKKTLPFSWFFFFSSCTSQTKQSHEILLIGLKLLNNLYLKKPFK